MFGKSVASFLALVTLAQSRHKKLENANYLFEEDFEIDFNNPGSLYKRWERTRAQGYAEPYFDSGN